MTEESTANKRRTLEEADVVTEASFDNETFTGHSFGPDQIVEMNQDLPEKSIVLFLPPDYDKKLLPVKARALRNWWEEDDKTRMHARFCLPLTMASGLGFYILSPATFTIEWDGDTTHDAQVEILDAASHAQIDNHSSFGSFTVQARFIARTKNIGDFVVVKGVANQYRRPFAVLEAMIESWWTPSEFGIVCLVNQPGKFTIQKGEPLAQMFVVNMAQAQYGLATADGYPPFWDEWTARRKPEIYNGRNMDYLRGVLPDQTPVCPHLKNWNEAPQLPTTVSVGQTVNSLWSAGDVARRAGNFEEAIKNYDASVQLAEDKNEVSENFLFLLMNVAREFQVLNNHAQAIRLLQKCIALSEEFHSNPEFTADLFNDVAYSQRTTRDFDGAVNSLGESLRRKRANDKTAPLSLARTLIDLGTLHDFCMRRDLAAPLLTEARAIYAGHLPENDPQHLYLKNVYACLLTHIGKYDDAEKLYHDVLKERIKLLGEDAVDVAFTYNDLGFHHKSTGNFEESEKAFRKCIEIRQKALGPEDLEVAAAHDDLSWMFREKKDFAQAKRELEKALSIRKKVLVPGDPQVSATHLALADVCNELGDKEGAAQARKNAERK